jgi:hypothetical protein
MAEAGEVLVVRAAEQAKRLLPRRTGQENDRSLDQEYQEGRLYRFGLDEEPFLKAQQRGAQVGHYFIDVKDFTQMTSRLKEDSTAEFLRREFYQPILTVAHEAYTGLTELGDRGGIYLNNLLGDAVTFSGDIATLVRVAARIREQLDAYSRRVAGDPPAPGSGESGPFQQGLVAGSFISFGPAPVVVTFSDPIWDKVKVSIAEKINESARGTARSPHALAMIREKLALLRQHTGNPQLVLPFRVYIEKPLDLPLDPRTELALRHAAAGKDTARLGAMCQQIVKRHVERLVSETVPTATSSTLFNAGDALSEEALRAYARAAPENHFTTVSLPVESLEAGLRSSFAFFEPSLRLAVARDFAGQATEIFRQAGTVVFKGFRAEKPVVIWERINLADPAGKQLLRSSALSRAVEQQARH